MNATLATAVPDTDVALGLAITFGCLLFAVILAIVVLTITDAYLSVPFGEMVILGDGECLAQGWYLRPFWRKSLARKIRMNVWTIDLPVQARTLDDVSLKLTISLRVRNLPTYPDGRDSAFNADAVYDAVIGAVIRITAAEFRPDAIIAAVKALPTVFAYDEMIIGSQQWPVRSMFTALGRVIRRSHKARLVSPRTRHSSESKCCGSS